MVALLLVIVAIGAKAWASKEALALRGRLIEEESRRKAAEERLADYERRAGARALGSNNERKPRNGEGSDA